MTAIQRDDARSAANAHLRRVAPFDAERCTWKHAGRGKRTYGFIVAIVEAHDHNARSRGNAR